MLIQARREGLRLFTQHHHALASGVLAQGWTRPGGGESPGERLPHRLVLAASLHDVAWRELDRTPVLDPETGRPHGFDTHPLPPKLEAYRRGLDVMEGVDPRAGLLGSLHYCSFLDVGRARAFLDAEEARRRRIREELLGRDGTGGDDPVESARRDLPWLKLLDGLSLRICLTPPPVPDGELPPWLGRGETVETPAGRELRLRWRSGEELEVRPWPLGGRSLELELPWRELPARRFPDPGSLEDAWEDARRGVWRPRLVPAAS
jgi:hypothetical protein